MDNIGSICAGLIVIWAVVTYLKVVTDPDIDGYDEGVGEV